MWTLAPASMAAGAWMVWTFRRTADMEALAVAVDRVQAHLLEFWLFVDAPALVWKSWKGLLAANARLLRLLLKPVMILLIPSALLYLTFDAQYGTAPLPVGKAAVVTMHLAGRLEAAPKLEAPEGIAVESPAVRVFSRGEVSWRVRPLRPVSSELVWVLGGRKLQKSIAAGPGFRFHFSRKFALGGPAEWMEVSYPAAEVGFLGMEADWVVWFLLFSILGAAGLALL